MSCGYLIFCGAQVASRISVPSFSDSDEVLIVRILSDLFCLLSIRIINKHNECTDMHHALRCIYDISDNRQRIMIYSAEELAITKNVKSSPCEVISLSEFM